MESQLYSVSHGGWLECIRADRANVTVSLIRGEFFDAGEYESCGNALIGIGSYRLKVRNQELSGKFDSLYIPLGVLYFGGKRWAGGTVTRIPQVPSPPPPQL